MTDQRTGFTVDGNVNPFQAAMRRMVGSAKDGASGVNDALGSLKTPLDQLKTQFLALTAVLAAGAVFKKAIVETADMTEQATNLARQLGVTANEARAYITAFNGNDGELADFVAASKGLGKQLKENEAEMQAMGLSTRDAAGNLRPLNQLVMEGIQVLNGYKEGADKNMASQVMFGKAVDTSSRLFLANAKAIDEARETNEAFRLEIGKNSVEAYEAFDAASDTATQGLKGVQKAIGDQLMPVVTSLINAFNFVLPAAIVVIRGALGGLAAAFHFVKNGVVVLFETINALVITVAEPIRALGASVGKALQGDFIGAADEMKSIGPNIAAAWERAMKRIADSSQDTSDKVKALFFRDTEVEASASGTKTYKKFDKDKDKKEKKESEPAYMQTYEAALSERKLAFERENSMREFNKAQELQYWREILDTYDVTSKDRLSIAMKVSKLEVDILREKARNAKEIEALRLEDQHQETQARITELQARSQLERDLGTITEAEFLEREKQYNQARLQAELDFIAAKIEIAKLDPEKNVVLLEQLEQQKNEIRRRYAAEAAAIMRAQVIEQSAPLMSIAEQIGQGFSQLTTKLLTSWKGVGQQLRSIVSGIGMSIIQEVILKPLQARIVAFAKERLLTMAGIGGDAAKAGSGAAASQASIPYIGPILAIAAMGAILAAVGGMKSKVPSAAGGFDIPQGLNPMTQLHEEEMVLPKDIANPLRRSLAEGGGAGGAGGNTYVIQAMDSRSFERFLLDNPDALSSAFRNAARRGHTG